MCLNKKGGTYNQAESLTIINVTSARTCTVTLVQAKVTFTMESTSCPDRLNSIASPCYILKYKDNKWDGTAQVGNTVYTNCIINSGGWAGCTSSNFSTVNISSVIWSYNSLTNDGYSWCRYWGSEDCTSVHCSVNLTCTN